MMITNLANRAETHLRRLCVDITSRHTGSAGNRAAIDYFAATVARFGFATETPPFDCIDWIEDGAELSVDGVAFPIRASPFSLGCDGRGPLVLISSVPEPAVALTSEELAELMAEITHTPRDTVEIVDPARLVEVAQALYNLLQHLSQDFADRRTARPQP